MLQRIAGEVREWKSVAEQDWRERGGGAIASGKFKQCVLGAGTKPRLSAQKSFAQT